MKLKDKRILVTGASSGIGAHLARLLADAGARVAVAARREGALEELAESAPDRIVPVAMDVSDRASAAEGVAQAVEALGGLDGLLNNAGTVERGLALETSDEDWDRVIEVNVNGAFRVAREAAKAMAEGGGGAIVTTASILGIGVAPGVAAYCTSKAAVIHMTRALALEWARHGIRVNAIAPGYFPTEMTSEFLESERGEKMMRSVPLGRVGELQDLDGPVMLLLSDAGSYITGVTLPVDGGHLCRSL